jgi:deazaflavin-dependent oxidoreductase (nitroreductase family)
MTPVRAGHLMGASIAGAGSGTAVGGAAMTVKTVPGPGGQAGPGLTSEQVWQAVARASFAVLSHLTPGGEPRSSGVVYRASGRRLVIAVAPGTWKARHVAADGRVAVTVPVRRGGVFSLVAPIPPATISFHGTAVLHPAGSPEARSALEKLGSLLPAAGRASACVIEITPVGAFRTYGLGVWLGGMRNPAAAQARVPVAPAGQARPKTAATGTVFGRYSRWMYRSGRPNWAARPQNRLSGILFGAGVLPRRVASLEVTGRRSGRVISFPVVIADCNGAEYLVSMLGEQANWVKNVRAAGGAAVLRRGRRQEVTLKEVDVADRAPIIRRYAAVAPGGRPHLGLSRNPSLEECEALAPCTPVFQIS